MKTKKLLVTLIALASAFILAVSGMAMTRVKADDPQPPVVEHAVDFTTTNDWEATYGSTGYYVWTCVGSEAGAYTKGIYDTTASKVVFPSVTGNGGTTNGIAELFASYKDTAEDAEFLEDGPISLLGVGNNFLWRAWPGWSQGVPIAQACAASSLKIPTGFDNVLTICQDEPNGQAEYGQVGFGNRYVTNPENLTDIVEALLSGNGGNQDNQIMFTVNEDAIGGLGLKITIRYNATMTLLYNGGNSDPKGAVDTTPLTYRSALISGNALTPTNNSTDSWENVIDSFEIQTTRDKGFYVSYTIHEAGTYTIKLKDKEASARVGMSGLFFDRLDPATHTITYVLDGGTNATTNPAAYVEGVGLANLGDATKSGYTFDGWYADAEFTSKVTSIPAVANQDITLYAKFTKIPDPVKEDEEEKEDKGGCGSVIGTTLGLVSLVTLAGATFVASRKKED